MTYFEVWAPKAQKIVLYLCEEGAEDPRTIDMKPGERGWWALDVPEAGPGIDYGFLVDGEGPFPDPRSNCQPNGVHGLSRLVSHAAFPWTDSIFQPRPLSAAVIYELHVGTFTEEGTFDAAIRKLDYLRDLGITHVELMPVNEFAGERGWGYDGVDLYAPEHSYGGPDGLKRLVDACHTRGLAVILDVVYNHLGPSGNYLEKYGNYFSERHMTNWGPAMNFDGPGSDEVRRFFIDNARMWLRDYHIDVLRLDAVHAIVDESAVHFLEELVEAAARIEIEIGRHIALIAESDLNDPRLVRPIEQGGYGLAAQWSDDFHHALHVLLTGEQSGYYAAFDAWDDLVKSLTSVFVYDGCYSPLRERKHGRPVDALPGYRFLGYIQNHDQIGNRAVGERISHLVGPELAMVAAAVVFASPFVPMIFMGEEWAASSPFQFFTDHEEELGKLVSEGRRNEFRDFGWQPEQVPDPQDPQTFQRSRLNWNELEQEPHAAVLDWYRRLIALHRGGPALADGRLAPNQVRHDANARWLIIDRGPVTFVCNFAEREQTVALPFVGARVVMASNPDCSLTEDGVYLPARSVLVLQS